MMKQPTTRVQNFFQISLEKNIDHSIFFLSQIDEYQKISFSIIQYFFFFLSQIDECKHVQKLENININVILKNIKISNKYIKILNIN